MVVAVDPPVTGHAGSDECGIVVAGVSMRGGPGDWRAYVLEDATGHAASPAQWAEAAIAAASAAASGIETQHLPRPCEEPEPMLQCNGAPVGGHA